MKRSAKQQWPRPAPMNAHDGKLWYAAGIGDLNAAHSALEQGANINVSANEGTPLHRAVRRGLVEMSHFLLSAGADIAFQSKAGRGQFPLHATVVGGLEIHLGAMRLLLEAGADPNCRRASDGSTPLHLVAQVRADDVDAAAAMRLLVEFGADPNATNKNRLTPLHQAGGSMSWSLRNARHLVDVGADPAFLDLEGSSQAKTPFQSAVARGWRSLIEFYIGECAQSLDQQARDGRSLVQLTAGNAVAREVFLSVLAVHTVQNALSAQADLGEPASAYRARDLSPL